MTDLNADGDAILGLVMRDPRELLALIELGISPAHFAVPAQREAFADILQAEKEGRPFDAAALGANKPLNALWLVDIYERAPVGSPIGYFAQKLLNRHWREEAARLISAVLMRIGAHDDSLSVDPLRTEIGIMADRVIAGAAVANVRGMKDVLVNVVANIEKAIRLQLEGQPVAVSTGIPELDRMLGGGWAKKRIAAVCARSGKGKTTLGLCFALSAALAGTKVVLFSTEADADDLAEKQIANLAGVNSTRIATGLIVDDETDRVYGAVEKLHSEANIVFDDTFAGNIQVFESRLRRLHRLGKAEFVVLDYVQQCFDPEFRQSQKPQMLAAVTSRIKRLALELDIPIVMLAQLRREVDHAEGFPTAADIGETSSIEKDSDFVLILHWLNDAGTASPWLCVAKNRRGVAGADKLVPLAANLAFSRFGGVAE